MQTQSPFLRLWELGESEHGGLIRAMISAAIGVLSGMLPYYMAAQIIITLLAGSREWPFYLCWCAAGIYAQFVLGRRDAVGRKLNA